MASVAKTGLGKEGIVIWIFTWRKDNLYLFALFFCTSNTSTSFSIISKLGKNSSVKLEQQKNLKNTESIAIVITWKSSQTFAFWRIFHQLILKNDIAFLLAEVFSILQYPKKDRGNNADKIINKMTEIM